MIRNNYHTHTFRCGHAIGSDEEYVIEALALGLHSLGFSDHVMLPNLRQPNVRGNFEVSEGYFASIRELEEKYAGRIRIYLAFEAEAFPEYFDYYRSLLESGTIDYLILGNHCTLDNGVIRSFFSKFTDKKDVIEYTDTLIEGLKTGLFRIIAHPDYYMDSYYRWDHTARKCARRIIKAAIKYDVLLEFNFACIRRGKVKKGKQVRYGYPFVPFWKMVRFYKAKVVLGLDAHAPSDLTSYLNDDGYRLVQSLHLNLVDEIRFDK